MRWIFNNLNKIAISLNAVKTLFDVAASGVSFANITNALDTLESKTDNFVKAVERENSQARLVFAKNIFFITPDGTINLPKTWNEFFNILKTGLENTQKEIGALDNPEENASWGRIKYHAEIFQKWYQGQDPRLLPLFESYAKKSGFGYELARLLPEQLELEIKGLPVTLIRPAKENHSQPTHI